MLPQPSDAVLAQFNARLIVPLGGRLNQHWLVDARYERLVLRRWAQPLEDIEYEMRLGTKIATLGWPVAPVLEGPVELEGAFWSLAPLLPGEPRSDKNSTAEQRAWALAGGVSR